MTSISDSRAGLTHAVESTNLADLLERILDKGIVVAGDIKVKLVEVELLTVELRLVICSVDRARELGLDWWNADSRKNGDFPLNDLESRLRRLEAGVPAEKETTPP
ncbi:gas vesicle protein [Methylosinus sp. KRF6]|uniref:gas vesicle protein n=1 Tax=Methylosinus sp. KRF6 TaxID=2846853 RepID=UPI001C0DC015|nr:gas vesicle protein [Methylosinus sp. KRF6]MBU3890902.1 gas vesicle protein [Methylosinus sp. KRF6]